EGPPATSMLPATTSESQSTLFVWYNHANGMLNAYATLSRRQPHWSEAGCEPAPDRHWTRAALLPSGGRHLDRVGCLIVPRNNHAWWPCVRHPPQYLRHSRTTHHLTRGTARPAPHPAACPGGPTV